MSIDARPTVARDAGLLTTIGSLPALLIVTLLLAP